MLCEPSLHIIIKAFTCTRLFGCFGFPYLSPGVAYFKSPSSLALLGPSSVGPDILRAVTIAASSSPFQFNVHAWLEYVFNKRVVVVSLTALTQVRLHWLQCRQWQRIVRACEGQGLDFGLFQCEICSTHQQLSAIKLFNA